VATALEYAGKKTLILCVGKNDVGGLSLNGYPLKSDHGVALLGTNAAGHPAITWSTGPNGPKNKNEPLLSLTPSPLVDGTSSATATSPTPPLETSATAQVPPAEVQQEPSAFRIPQALNTARDMIVVGSGPGSELLNGFMDNTEVFKILQKGL